MKKSACLFLNILSLSFFAQKLYYSDYSWEQKPAVYQPSEKEKKSELVVVFQKKIQEVSYDKDGQAVLYETVHNRYHVNSPKAIDGVNKGYMAQSGVIEEMSLMARCITPDNKVIPFNKGTIKDVDNLEGAGPFKIFAIDGVDNGCDVEILYTNKKQFHPYAYYYIQSRAPIAYYEHRLITPKNLVFDTKCYNGLENFTTDASDTLHNHLVLVKKNMEGVESEKYSAGKANFMGLIYQLAYNSDRKKSRIYSWDIISREFYSSLYTLEKNESKAIEKILDKNKLTRFKTSEEKIRALDSYIKTNYEISEGYDALGLEKGLEAKKLGNSSGMKFYIAALKLLQVPFELVIGTERNDLKFDAKFPSYVYMKEFLFFFPESNKYLSPLSLYSRYGFPAPDVLSTEALFIKEVNIGDMFSSSAKTKTISITDPKESYHNTDVKVNLDLEAKTAKLEVTQSLGGYNAYYVQPIYRYLTNEQKEELHKNYQLTESSEGIKAFDVKGVAEEDVFVKPMTIQFSMEQSDFLEHAGNKFILKAGLLIGPQAELYQEEVRREPADMDYPHHLNRHLEIGIPQGYKATNLKDLVIDKICQLDGQTVASFNSSYEVKDNKIIIKVYEDYNIISYPLQVFDSFKGVINAAADFNKKNLIFEKE